MAKKKAGKGPLLSRCFLFFFFVNEPIHAPRPPPENWCLQLFLIIIFSHDFSQPSGHWCCRRAASRSGLRGRTGLECRGQRGGCPCHCRLSPRRRGSSSLRRRRLWMLYSLFSCPRSRAGDRFSWPRGEALSVRSVVRCF